MRRRRFLATAAVAAVGSVAGCSGGKVDGEVAVDETVLGQTQVYNFEVEEGDTINMYANHEAGPVSVVTIRNPNGDVATEREVQTENSWSVTAESSGVYRAEVLPADEVRVVVGVQSG